MTSLAEAAEFWRNEVLPALWKSSSLSCGVLFVVVAAEDYGRCDNGGVVVLVSSVSCQFLRCLCVNKLCDIWWFLNVVTAIWCLTIDKKMVSRCLFLYKIVSCIISVPLLVRPHVFFLVTYYFREFRCVFGFHYRLIRFFLLFIFFTSSSSSFFFFYFPPPLSLLTGS